MDNSEVIAGVLKSLYDNAVNEFENHPAECLNESDKIMIEKFLNIIKDTYNEYCKPSDRL